MDLSLRWLRDYVDVQVSNKEFFEKMTLTGSKVELWRTEGEDILKVVVGRVLSIEPHPDSDHLLVCSVDIGAEPKLQIVTGAQNLKAGDLVPVALDGSTLPGGAIHTTVMRGVKSEGMLCSIQELGLTVNDYPYSVEHGIFVIEEPCTLGQDIREVLGINDTVYEFEITPNRPDCLCVLGLAREASATFNVPFTPPKPVVRGGAGDIHDVLSVEVRNQKLCPRYMARTIKNVRIKPSPRWMRERIRAAGMRPINNIVDITNFVLLEYGQPLHAFDYRHVAGGQIIVRNAAPNEYLTTLDGIDRALSPEMLVIADAEKPSVIAGVMGGEYSGIADDTSMVIFESANFFGPSIRGTSRKLGLRTESSGRYEKGLDPVNCAAALDRACQLVELLDAGDVMDGVIDIAAERPAPARIPLDVDYINRYLDIELDREQMTEILRRLEFVVEDGWVTVPSFRASDVKEKVDLTEEIARFYGYDKIPMTGIRGAAKGQLSPRQHFERRMVQTMVAQGYYEVMTYTFISPKYYDKIRLPADSSLRDSVVILSPLGEDSSIMRTTTLPSMLEVISRNWKNRNPSGAFFEIAREYHPTTPNELPVEKDMLTLGLYGAGADFFALKGTIELLLSRLGLHDVDVTALTDHPTFHPGRAARLSENGRELGILGQIHPSVAANYGLDTTALLAELDIDTLFALGSLERKYVPTPRYPASVRDIALVCDEALPLQSLLRAIKGVSSLLESVELFDIYRGAQVPEGKKSIAFNLTLRADDHTLIDSEVDAVFANVLLAAEKLGAALRK